MILNLTDSQYVVARDQKYSENNGAWVRAIVYDEEKREVFYVGGVYASLELNDPGFQKMASEKQVKAANKIWQHTKMDCGTLQDETTYIGCIVTLTRSRHATNNIPLLVTNFKDKHWSSKGYMVPPRIEVEHLVTLERNWVNRNCIQEVIAGKSAWWAD